MSGIHQRVAFKLAEILGSRSTANDPDASAQASHDAFERLPRLERELEDLSRTARIGEGVVDEIDQSIARLNESPVKSAELQLCIRELEVAGFRLRQHLGTGVEPSKSAEAGAPLNDLA